MGFDSYLWESNVASTPSIEARPSATETGPWVKIFPFIERPSPACLPTKKGRTGSRNGSTVQSRFLLHRVFFPVQKRGLSICLLK